MSFSGSEAELRGTLKISKPSSGLLNLAPLLVAFHHRYPDINLVLTAGGERSEIARMEADVAIRLTNNPPEALVARKLGQLPINIFGSHAYLERAGTRNLDEYDWLVWHDADSLLNMEPALKRNIPNARIVLRTDSYNELFEAVNAGMGVSLLSPLRFPKHTGCRRYHRRCINLTRGCGCSATRTCVTGSESGYSGTL